MLLGTKLPKLFTQCYLTCQQQKLRSGVTQLDDFQWTIAGCLNSLQGNQHERRNMGFRFSKKSGLVGRWCKDESSQLPKCIHESRKELRFTSVQICIICLNQQVVIALLIQMWSTNQQKQSLVRQSSGSSSVFHSKTGGRTAEGEITSKEKIWEQVWDFLCLLFAEMKSLWG